MFDPVTERTRKRRSRQQKDERQGLLETVRVEVRTRILRR